MTSSAQNSRQTLAQKGTAAVPGIAFQGDNNTGVFSPGANEIAVVTNGTTAMSVDSSQNVALTNALPVGSGGTGFKTYTTGDILYASGSGALSKLPIGSNGYVLTVNSGVPAWTAAASSGVASISFGSTGLTPSTATTGAVSVGGTLSISNGGTGSGSASGARNNLGLGSIATQNANSVSITGGSLDNVSLDNVSLFVMSPGYPSLGNASGFGNLNFSSFTSCVGNNSEFRQYTNNIEAFRTTSTTFALSVAMTSATCYFGTTWTNLSDARIKTDVTPYTLGTSAIIQLDPVNYIYNGQYGSPNNGIIQTGLIAQQVLETPFSSMVGTRVYTDPNTGEQTTLYDLNTNQLVFSLINAVKELNARVQALEAKVG